MRTVSVLLVSSSLLTANLYTTGKAMVTKLISVRSWKVMTTEKVSVRAGEVMTELAQQRSHIRDGVLLDLAVRLLGPDHVHEVREVEDTGHPGLTPRHPLPVDI